MKEIEELIGAAEFKALAREIEAVAPVIIHNGTQEIFRNRCYLFSIGDGHGLSTYLTLLGDLLRETGLSNVEKEGTVFEMSVDEYRDSMTPFDDVLDLLEKASGLRARILCVDISEWMDKTDTNHFKQFLRRIGKEKKAYTIVFRIPFVDKTVLEKIRYSLNDLLTVKAVTFPPFTESEIEEFASRRLKNYGFTVEPEAWSRFQQRIAEEKSDGKFYGLDTVTKVLDELMYEKQLSASDGDYDDRVISESDAAKLCANDISNLSGEEELNALVGCEEIKKRVREIIAQIVLTASGEDKPCIHMKFVGNPGTGKTTVARIIGKILKEKGVLRVGGFYERAGRDLCGRYIGETAPKTAGICRDAYGSVLFIDEAYSLFRGDESDRDFGREALDTLVAVMENHRNDIVIIMSGYTDEMDRMMKGNAGLAGRIPYTLEFPNFTREQLFEIFRSMIGKRYKYEESLLSAAKEYFDGISDEVIKAKEFSNARFVRNLFERTRAKASMRCQLNGEGEIFIKKADFEEATADREFILSAQKKVKIGFR